MTSKETLPSRYHPVHAVLHWLIALMTILALIIGMFMLNPMPDTPAKMGPLGFHAVWGGILLLLLVARLIVRFSLQRPAPADAGNAFLNFAAKAFHFLLYLGLIALHFGAAMYHQVIRKDNLLARMCFGKR
jgi:cytochrome b561